MILVQEITKDQPSKNHESLRFELNDFYLIFINRLRKMDGIQLNGQSLSSISLGNLLSVVIKLLAKSGEICAGTFRTFVEPLTRNGIEQLIS